MPTLQSILKDAKSLTNAEIEVLFDNIGELLWLKSISSSINGNSREQRYSDGVVCVHCSSKHVIKHGKKKGVQRFRCKVCGKHLMILLYLRWLNLIYLLRCGSNMQNI